MRKHAKEAVGIIGLGVIGQGVARHLKASGIPVFVWSRSPKPFPNFLGSAVEVAESTDVLQLFVSDGAALRAMISDLVPVLRREHIVVAHPTVEPNAMIDAARLVEQTGAIFLEAPFTGSKIAAEGGQLVYYVSGPEEGINRARSVLQRSSRAIVPTGPFGAASVLKIATNMITAATVEVLAEALAIVAKSGLPPEVLGRALEHNAARSGVIDLKMPKMLSGDFSTHFSMKHMLKDAGLALSLSEALGVETPVASTVAAVLFQGVRNGLGDEDFAAIAKRYGFAPVKAAAPERETVAPKPAAADVPPHPSPEEMEPIRIRLNPGAIIEKPKVAEIKPAPVAVATTAVVTNAVDKSGGDAAAKPSHASGQPENLSDNDEVLQAIGASEMADEKPGNGSSNTGPEDGSDQTEFFSTDAPLVVDHKSAAARSVSVTPPGAGQAAHSQADNPMSRP